MYSIVLMSRQSRQTHQAPGPGAEDAFYDDFGVIPFGGVRRTLRSLGQAGLWLGVVWRASRRSQRKASVL